MRAAGPHKATAGQSYVATSLPFKRKKRAERQRAMSVLLQTIYTQFPIHEVVKTNTVYNTACHKYYINKGYDGQVLLRDVVNDVKCGAVKWLLLY